MSKDESDPTGTQTVAIHADASRNKTSAVSPPIWQTTTFRADSSEHFSEIAAATHPSEFYTRYGNPTHGQVEAVMAALEGGEAALVTGSGMGAIFCAVMSLLRSGDHVVAQRNLYPGSMTLLRELLPRWGVDCAFVIRPTCALSPRPAPQHEADLCRDADQPAHASHRPQRRRRSCAGTRHHSHRR